MNAFQKSKFNFYSMQSIEIVREKFLHRYKGKRVRKKIDYSHNLISHNWQLYLKKKKLKKGERNFIFSW